MKDKRILTFRNDGLGDLFLWLPFARRMKEKFPEYSLEIAGTYRTRKFLEKIPFFDKVYSYPECKHVTFQIFAQIPFLLLTPSKYEMVFNPMFSDLRCLENYIVSKVKMRVHKRYFLVCFQHCYRLFIPFLRFFNHFFPNDFVVIPKGCHILEMYQLFFQQVCKEVLTYPIYEHFDWIPNSEKYNSEIVFCIGASSPKRIWPVENYKLLAKSMAVQKIILLGGKKDMLNGEIIAEGLDNVTNLCGETNLEESISILKNAKIVFSNDSGFGHASALLGKETFIISGRGHHGKFFPYPKAWKNVHTIEHEGSCSTCMWICKEKIRRKIFPCLAEISSEEVLSFFTKEINEK